MMQQAERLTYILIGPASSGKTSLIQQIKNYIADPQAPLVSIAQPDKTIGLDFYTLTYHNHKFQLWEYAHPKGIIVGIDEMLYVSNAIFVCIDLQQHELNTITDSLKQLPKGTDLSTIIFIATKIDTLTQELQEAKKLVFVEDVNAWQKSNSLSQNSNQIFYTSAITGAGIQKLGKWFSAPIDAKINKETIDYLLEQTIKQNLIAGHDKWTFSGCIAFSRYTDDAGRRIPAGVKQILNIINNNNTYTQAHVDEILSIAQSKIYDSSAFFGLSRRSDDTKKFYQNIVATIENYNKTTIKLASSNQSPAQTSLNPQQK